MQGIAPEHDDEGEQEEGDDQDDFAEGGPELDFAVPLDGKEVDESGRSAKSQLC